MAGCSGHIRCSIVVSIPACHAGDPVSIPGGGVVVQLIVIALIICLDVVENVTVGRRDVNKKKVKNILRRVRKLTWSPAP